MASIARKHAGRNRSAVSDSRFSAAHKGTTIRHGEAADLLGTTGLPQADALAREVERERPVTPCRQTSRPSQALRRAIYAKQNATKHDDFDFPGFGFVDKFSPKGKLLQRLKHGPWLNSPWGVALAPANFGFFSNHLLIGNGGSGQIAVYDVDGGGFDGLLRDANGHAIQSDRLCALRFGNDHGAGPSNWLFFTAGIGDDAQGLFGFFTRADNSAPASNGDDQ